MAAPKNTSYQRKAPSPSPRLPGLLREAKWLALIGLTFYLALVLYTYDRADPGWSHSSTEAHLHNAGGQFGAYLSDLLLYVFGISAWWSIAFLLYVVWWGYRQIDGEEASDRRSLIVAGIGFLILILASSAIEALRLYTLKATLPLAPGGMLGISISEITATTLGFSGATLVLLVAWGIGFSLFSGLSWLDAIERLGAAMANTYRWTFQTWERWQDQRAGKVAMEQREEAVSEVKKRLDEHVHVPLKIEQPTLEIPQSTASNATSNAASRRHCSKTCRMPHCRR